MNGINAATQLAFSPLTHDELNTRARTAITSLGFAALSCIRHGDPLGTYEKQTAEKYERYQSAALQRCEGPS